MVSGFFRGAFHFCFKMDAEMNLPPVPAWAPLCCLILRAGLSQLPPLPSYGVSAALIALFFPPLSLLVTNISLFCLLHLAPGQGKVLATQ